MLSKVDTAFYTAWVTTNFNITSQASTGFLNGFNKRVYGGLQEIDITLNITDSGFGEPPTYGLYGNSEEVIELGKLPKYDSGTLHKTYKSTLEDVTYSIKNKTYITQSNYTKGTVIFKYRYYKQIFSYKKIKIYDVKTIGQKINSYLFGILPTGERRNGN